MPTYEYECTACGQHIEVFQRFTEDALSTCGVCGGPLRKVFHPAGIVFKGSGFYATDSRAGAGPSTKKEAETSSGSSSDSQSSDGASDKPSERSDTSSSGSSDKPSDGGKATSTPKEGKSS
jgi:putative FmdB family regulatory protein